MYSSGGPSGAKSFVVASHWYSEESPRGCCAAGGAIPSLPVFEDPAMANSAKTTQLGQNLDLLLMPRNEAFAEARFGCPIKFGSWDIEPAPWNPNAPPAGTNETVVTTVTMVTILGKSFVGEIENE